MCSCCCLSKWTPFSPECYGFSAAINRKQPNSVLVETYRNTMGEPVHLKWWIYQHTWLILLNVNWCVLVSGWTWAIDSEVVPSVFSCCVTMCCGWLSFAFPASTSVCWVPCADAIDTAMVGCCCCCCCTCCCACCDVDGISSGSFFTVTVGSVELFPPVFTKHQKWNQPHAIDTLRSDLLFRSFLIAGFEKCLSSKCRRRLRDCLMTAPQMGHDAGCSDWDRDLGSGYSEESVLISIQVRAK